MSSRLRSGYRALFGRRFFSDDFARPSALFGQRHRFALDAGNGFHRCRDADCRGQRIEWQADGRVITVVMSVRLAARCLRSTLCSAALWAFGSCRTVFAGTLVTGTLVTGTLVSRPLLTLNFGAGTLLAIGRIVTSRAGLAVSPILLRVPVLLPVPVLPWRPVVSRLLIVALVARVALLRALIALRPFLSLRALVALRAVVAILTRLLLLRPRFAWRRVELVAVAVLVETIAVVVAVAIVGLARTIGVRFLIPRAAFGEHTEIVIGKLEIIFGEHTVALLLRITRKRFVFLEQLRGIATRAVVDAVAHFGTATAAVLALAAPAATATGLLAIVDQVIRVLGRGKSKSLFAPRDCRRIRTAGRSTVLPVCDRPRPQTESYRG